MKRRNIPLPSVVICTALVAGCSGGSTPAASTESAGSATTSAASARPTETGLPVGSEPVTLDPAKFSTEITNPYWPMTPGTRWTYKEVQDDGTVLQAVIVVTRQTKKIANGVTARVIRDTVTEEGKVIEDTFDWYAQDDAGNIWYLGEDTAEFENGKVTSRAGSFEAGRDGALPGIAIPGNPRPGLKYRQEYYKGEAEDNGEVLSTEEMVEVPTGRYQGALLTKDTITIEPDVQEYKVYAKGVGPVLVLGVSGGIHREDLQTVDKAPPTAGTGPLGHPNP